MKSEEILSNVKLKREVKTTKTAVNIAANMFGRGVAGRVTTDFILSISKEKLYIESENYNPFGGGKEVISCEEYPLSTIKSFNLEEKDGVIIIDILISKKDNFILKDRKDKEIKFICDNEKYFNALKEIADIVLCLKDAI